MKNVYFNSNDSLVTLASPNQTSETLPRDYRKGTINSLCRNLTLLFAILTMSMANIGTAWAQTSWVRLDSIDFTNTTNFPAQTLTGQTKTISGVYFFAKSSKNIKVNNTSAGIDFDGSNGGIKDHAIAIPVTGVNEELKIIVYHDLNNTSANFRTAITHSTNNIPTEDQTTDLAIGNSGAKNKNDYVQTKNSLTGSNYIIWVCEAGSSYKVVKRVAIYTKAPSCDAADLTASNITSNGNQEAGTGITFSKVGSPASGDTWYWQTSATGTDKTYNATSPYTTATTVGSYTVYLRAYNTAGNCWGTAASMTNTIYPAPSAMIHNTFAVNDAWGSTIATQDKTNITGLNAMAAVGESVGTGSNKEGLTQKIPSQSPEDASKYMSLSFNVASGKQLNVTSVVFDEQPVSNTGTFKVSISDNQGSATKTQTIASGAAGSKHTLTLDGDIVGSFKGTVTVKVWAYGWGDGYRFGDYFYINGTVTDATACTAPNHVDISGRWDRFAGETISLTATAYSSAGTGSPIADANITGWQWQKLVGSTWTDVSNGTSGGATTSGATTKNLQITNCIASNSGKYRCVVSTGATCSTASATATDGSEGHGVKVYVLECYNGGTTEYHFTRTGDSQAGTLTIDLAANTNYTFKMHVDNTYYGNNGTIYTDATNWVMCNSDNGGSCASNLTVASGLWGGTFTFGVEYSTGGNSSVLGEPEISVTYPTKTIYVGVSASNYLADNAKIGIYYWNTQSGDVHDYTDFLTADACGNIAADIPAWARGMIILRQGPAASSVSFSDTKWNQSTDISLASDKNKYTFSSWNCSDGKDCFTASSYSPSTYTISFNNGGGTGSMSSIEDICPNSNQALPANTFTRTDYIFDGWHADVATKVGGSNVAAGADIADEATLQEINSDITLTAQWTACTGPTISANDRTGTVDGTHEVGEELGTASVTATAGNGGTLSYKWYYYDDSPGKPVDPNDYTAAPGTNNQATYQIPSSSTCTARHYFCVVSEEGCSTTVEGIPTGALTLTEPVDPCSEPAKVANEIARFFVPCGTGQIKYEVTNANASTNDNTFTTYKVGSTSADNWYVDATSGLRYGKLTANDSYIQLKLKSGNFQAGDVVTAYFNLNNATKTGLTLNTQGSSYAITPAATAAGVETSGSYTLVAGAIESDGSIKLFRAGSATYVNRIIVTRAPVAASVTATLLTPAYMPTGSSGVQIGVEITGASTGWKYRVKNGSDGYEAPDNTAYTTTTWTMTSTIGAGANTYVVELYDGTDTKQATSNTITVTGETAYPVTITAGANGTVSPSGEVQANGSHIKPEITATPNSGYRFVNWTLNNSNATLADANSATTTITNATGACEITANFETATLTALVNGTRYDVADMVPSGTTISGSEQTPTGLSANTKFYLVGPTAMAVKSDSKEGVNGVNFSNSYYFKEAASITSNTPTSRAIKFIVPATGTLTAWVRNGKDIKLGKEGAVGTVLISSQTNEYYSYTLDVTAGTYYLYATAGSTTLYAVKFDIVSTYTLTVSGASVDNPMTADSKTGAISGVTITGSPVSSIPSGTTTSTSDNTFTVNKGTPETVTATATISGSSAECDECTYVFDHWTNVPATVTADVSTIEAVYKTTYTISFKETDGTAVAGISSSSYVYGVGKLASTLPTPSKSGYSFSGWYKENTLTNAATNIANDAWGNVTYYAKWTENTGNKVTYNGNGNTSGSVPTDDTDYAVGDIVTVKGNTGDLAKTGYVFRGWNTANDNTGTFYPADYKFAMPAGAVTLYAVWGTGQVCYTITDFETSQHSAVSKKPDSRSYYFYGYKGTKDTEHAVTITTTSSNNKGYNGSTDCMRFYYGSSVYIYADNTTTSGTPASFEDVTSISLKIKLKKTAPTLTIKVGSTTIANAVSLSSANTSTFTTFTYDDLDNLDGVIQITNNGSGDSNYEIYLDDIEICTGSGSSGYTVTFDNNGEGTYSKTITNVPSGSKIGVPIPAPTADGNTFGGWYKENTCTNEWNFASDVVNSDKTLYAKWTSCLPVITTQPVGNTYVQGTVADALTVVPSGDVTGYQWFSNDENNATTGTPIDGQTTGGYTPETSVIGTTYYYCVVSNACGSTASNVVAIVVNDGKETPCAAWTIDEPTHGGQGFSFSVVAKKQGCSNLWDGTLTEGMLTVSEGVVLGAVTVNNTTKTISGTYGVTGSAESPVTFYLSLPATATQTAATLSQTRTFTACAGGAEEFYWSANVSSPLTANTAAKLVSKTTDTEIELSGSTSANSSTRTTDTATGIVDGTTYSFLSSDPHHTYIKMGSGNTFHFTTTATATISIQFSTPSNENSGIEIRQSSSSGTVVASKMITSKAGQFQTLTASSVAAGTYYVVAVNKEMNIGEILVVQGSGSAGNITPTLAWSNDQLDGATVEKNEDAADFSITATRSDANALASLGTISYSSSNASVATVNAATGQVTIADNIDFGSETYKTTTITATLAASGCYKAATITYVLQVNKHVCTEAAGTVSIKTDNGCSGQVLTVIGFEDGATGFQWYKNGDAISGATSQDYTATSSGTYSVVTTKTCAVASSNSVEVTIETATATKIVDEWYVKKDRRTPDIALVQTTKATGFTVSPTDIGGCTFYLGDDGIIYLRGQKDNGDEPAHEDGTWTAGNVTVTITATACGNAEPVSITIHKQAETLKPSIAFVVDGGDGEAVDNVTAAKTSSRDIWTHLSTDFTLTGCNIYWTTDEKALRQYYSQYDAILITDDPNTQKIPGGKDEKKSVTQGYVNAMGTLIDVRPLLTMEAYVSRLDNWDCVKGKPESPNPRDYVLKLQCKEHAIYQTIAENGTTVRHEEIEGIDHWYITMVDPTNSTYADTDDEDDASGTPALQGFDGKVNVGMLGIGTIANEKLQGGIERQAEPAARMMVLGINNKAMAALTTPGKQVITNALHYLLETDMESLEDCSNYFNGNNGTSTDWFTASNWSAGKVPDPTVRAIILAPCVISGQTARASSVDIAVGGTTGRYKSGTTECEGNISISANGALVLNEGVSRIEDAPNFGVLNRKPTRTSDLAILSASTGNGTLILNNEEGNTQATVAYYSKASTDEADIWNWQYMAVPFNDNSSAYRNYYDSYLYRWAENCSGWEVVPNQGAVYPWVGYTITQVGTKTYYMDGTLVETGEQTFTVPAGADLVLGNSWTAPLQVKQFEDDDFDGLVKNVYLFNTGYDYDKEGTMYEDGTAHYEAGTYVVVPIHSSPYTGDSLISSLQAFTVTSDGGEGTLTLNYERHVRPARSTDKVNAGAMHAPSRMMAQDDKPEVLKIWASGQRFDDRLVVLEREDFSTGYDEGWDGEKVLMGEAAPTVYTVMENGYESVTATNDYEGTLIGFKAGEDSEYTFRFDYDDNAEAIYLLDMDVRMYVRILSGITYTFTCPDKGEHNRFLLTRKAPGIYTGYEPIDGSGGIKATKFIKDNKLYILLNGTLYDATGKIVVR